jgi:hypothetical protein
MYKYNKWELQNTSGEMGSILKIIIDNQYICRRTGHKSDSEYLPKFNIPNG